MAEPEARPPQPADSSSPATGPLYAIAEGVAWLDAAEGGRDDPVVWATRVQTGALYELRDAAWLLWTVLADGPAYADQLEASLRETGTSMKEGQAELSRFLDELVLQGLVERRAHPGPGNDG